MKAVFLAFLAAAMTISAGVERAEGRKKGNKVENYRVSSRKRAPVTPPARAGSIPNRPE